MAILPQAIVSGAERRNCWAGAEPAWGRHLLGARHGPNVTSRARKESTGPLAQAAVRSPTAAEQRPCQDRGDTIRRVVNTCQLCGGEQRPGCVGTDRNRRVSGRKFVYMRCAVCRTLELRDVPHDLGRFYAGSGGGKYFAITPADQLDAVASSQAWRMDFVLPYVQHGVAVEVGPGAGHFAHLMRRAGFDVRAVERDPGCVAYLRDIVGVDVTESGDPAAFLRQERSVDVVAMWHALEHLPQPFETLDAAAASLRPGGILVVAVPNPDSLGSRVLGRLWAHLDAPRHLFLIPPVTLAAKLRDLGMELLTETTVDAGARFYNRFAWERLLRRANPTRLEGMMGYHGGRFAAKLLAPLEERGMRGSTYTVVARRLPPEVVCDRGRGI